METPRLGVELLEDRRLLSAHAYPAPATVFYDYLEDGVLKGGSIAVDAANPYHTAVDPTETADLWDVTTIIDNGPTTNRIDLVFVGDGYTAAELGTYAGQVSSVVPEFFGETPLDAYWTFFNVHRVDVISNESGVDNDPTQGIERDTALDMGFWSRGIERLLGIDVGKALAAAAEAPDADQVLAVANSSKGGGAGYPSDDLGTLSGARSDAGQTALHEFGHSFGDLEDEYFRNGEPIYTGPEPADPNVSIYDAATMAGLQAKWHLWLDEPNVDTFEGAMDYQTGIYRPTENSKMRALGQPFEQVNAEQLVIKAYETVRPIDDATEPGTYDQTAALFVDPADPASHRLDVQWYLDGSPIPGAVGTTLDASTLGLSPGTYTVTVNVVDNTDLVRDEAQRGRLMSESRSWTLEVPSEIRGSKWHDLNSDGVWEFGEPGLAGWHIYVDLDGNGRWDPGEPDGWTDEDGDYVISGLRPGTYAVDEVLRHGWEQTFPVGRHTVTVGPGQSIEGVNFGNEHLGEIRGGKWNDLDGDGVWSPVEPGLISWTIYLDENLNGQRDVDEPSTQTGPDGRYFLPRLSPGTYTVAEEPQDGWQPTYPEGGSAHQVSVAPGQIVQGIDFGNAWGGPPGEIRGSKLNDLDRDGERDVGEPGLPNWQIYIDFNHNGRWDPGEPASSTDDAGNYVLEGLAPGSYSVCETLQEGWEPTYPVRCHTVTIAPGEIVERVDFLNQQLGDGQIHGGKWHDLDRDGVRELGEPGLVNWRIYLDENLNGQWDLGEIFTSSGPDGSYFLTGLSAGCYTVAEEVPPGWRQTYPGGDGTHQVCLGQNEIVQGIDFGNAEDDAGEIRGSKWHDLDGDGVWDSDEPGLVNWIIYIDGNLNGQRDPGEPYETTNPIGDYSFTGLPAGCHTVAEEVPPDWRQTYPGGDAAHQVCLDPGQIVEDVDFGNLRKGPGEIHGGKFNDLDGDGVWDPLEPGLVNWKIYLDENLNGQRDPGEPYGNTGPDGSYSIGGLSPGTYAVRETLPPGWQQTYPRADARLIDPSGQQVGLGCADDFALSSVAAIPAGDGTLQAQVTLDVGWSCINCGLLPEFTGWSVLGNEIFIELYGLSPEICLPVPGHESVTVTVPFLEPGQYSVHATLYEGSIWLPPLPPPDSSPTWETTGTVMLRSNYHLVTLEDGATVGDIDFGNQTITRIDVGDHYLLADTARQAIEIYVTGGAATAGMNLSAQIADGGPMLGGLIDGPEFADYDPAAGTIWEPCDPMARPPDILPGGQLVVGNVALTTCDTVPADGLLVTLFVDTTGFSQGTWDLSLGGTLNGPTELLDNSPVPQPIPITIIDGTITITRVVDRHVFYNDSAFDGNDPAANQADDDAIAPHPERPDPSPPPLEFGKQALLPGQTATFANYTSFSRGINGVMVDVTGLPSGTTLTDSDFEFRVGNDDHPEAWPTAPAPRHVTVRPGDGTGGSDRVTLVWDDNAIGKQWLQVTVLATANTGLVDRDVFYFGNAVGDCGNSTTDAKVNATDMLAARNNPRDFINPAPIDFFADFNRDARVNAIDMLIARDNPTSFLNALKLITVPAGKASGGALPDRPATPSGDTTSVDLAWLYQWEQVGTDEGDSPGPDSFTDAHHQPRLADSP